MSFGGASGLDAAGLNGSSSAMSKVPAKKTKVTSSAANLAGSSASVKDTADGGMDMGDTTPVFKVPTKKMKRASPGGSSTNVQDAAGGGSSDTDVNPGIDSPVTIANASDKFVSARTRKKREAGPLTNY